MLIFFGTRYSVSWERSSSSRPILTSSHCLILCPILSPDQQVVAFHPDGKLKQRFGRRPGYDVPFEVEHAGMARADEHLPLFIVLHQATQLGADLGEGEDSFVLGVDQDGRGHPDH